MKRALLDIDGVCADFTGHTLDLLRSKVPKEEIAFTSMADHPDVDQELAEALWVTPEFWLTLPPMERAQKGVQTLLNRDYEVIFVSSPYLGCPLWLHVRRIWLAKNFPEVDEKNFIPCPGKWKKLVDGTFLYEDRPENARGWEEERGGQAFIFPQPYNEDVTDMKRLDWDDLTVYV